MLRWKATAGAGTILGSEHATGGDAGDEGKWVVRWCGISDNAIVRHRRPPNLLAGLASHQGMLHGPPRSLSPRRANCAVAGNAKPASNWIAQGWGRLDALL